MYVYMIASKAYLGVLSLSGEKYSNLPGTVLFGKDVSWRENAGSLDELVIVIGCKAKYKQSYNLSVAFNMKHSTPRHFDWGEGVISLAASVLKGKS